MQPIESMAAACREGSRDSLDHPRAVNAVMHDLNPDMDLQTFAEAAAQKPLIATDRPKKRAWISDLGPLEDAGRATCGFRRDRWFRGCRAVFYRSRRPEWEVTPLSPHRSTIVKWEFCPILCRASA